MVDGDMTSSVERQVEAAVASVRILGNAPTTLRGISNLARLQLLQGRPRRAALTIERMVQLAAERGGLHTLLNGVDYYFMRGDLLREWNRFEEAEQHLARGLDLVSETMTADAEMIGRGYMALARLQQARGESTQAFATLDAFAQVAYPHGFAPVLLAHGAAVRTQVELAQGNLAAAVRWVETHDVPEDSDPKYPREQEYLTLVRVRIAQARAHPAGHYLAQALGLLDRLLQDAEAKARVRSVLEILVLRALALSALGDNAGALEVLGRALRLAEPEGYVRLFLDEGTLMVALLRQAHARGLAPGYVAALLEASGGLRSTASSLHAPTPASLVDPLTSREREVLRLLLEGASNREIAHGLVLSVNTVKKHVYNICGKLGVASRAQAVARARSLNLLREA
jgi:LuxR family maltose regulon positive regulatory protein